MFLELLFKSQILSNPSLPTDAINPEVEGCQVV
jgi:hypothetical protein